MELKKLNAAAGATYIYIIVLLVSCLLIIGYYSDWFSSLPESLQELLRELGFAGVVSVILVFTIEGFSRKRHQAAADHLIEAINTDLFRAIYKRRIPAPVLAEIEKCFFKANLYRRELDVCYTLMDFDDDTARLALRDHLKCLVQVSYVMENLTDLDVTEPIRLFVSTRKGFEDLCKINSVTIGGRELTAAEIAASTKMGADTLEFVYSWKFGRQSSVRVEYATTLVKRVDDDELWSSIYPSDGLSLTVATPKRGLEVNATAAHSEKLRLALGSNEAMKKWKLEYGMFPYQAVAFWWRPVV